MNTTTTTSTPEKNEVTLAGVALMYAWTFNKAIPETKPYQEALRDVEMQLTNVDPRNAHSSFNELAIRADAVVSKGLEAYTTELQKAININN